MEKLSLPEIPDYWITLLAVIIAGSIALFNLRHSIKLQAKNKWKEDFRNHVSDYLESLLNNIFVAEEYFYLRNGEVKSEKHWEKISLISRSSSELLGRFSKIQLMLDWNDKESKNLIKLQEKHQDYLSKKIDGTYKEEDVEAAIEAATFSKEFSALAKRVYDKKK